MFCAFLVAHGFPGETTTLLVAKDKGSVKVRPKSVGHSWRCRGVAATMLDGSRECMGDAKFVVGLAVALTPTTKNPCVVFCSK